MSLTWTTADKIQNPLHEDLARKLRDPTKAGMFEYVDRKKKLYRALGYEKNVYRGTVSFKVPSPNDRASLYDTLANHAIGLNDEMPVTQIKLDEVRFGISKPVPGMEGQPENCHIVDPTIDTGYICFFSNNQSAKFVQIECSFYHAGIVFPFLPKEFHRMKIQTKFFSIIIALGAPEGKLNIQISINTDQDETIDDLLKYARFVNICAEGNGQNACFSLKLTKNLEIGKTKFPIISSFPDEGIATAKLIERLWDVLRFFDIDKDNKINLNKIWNRQDTISFFWNAIDASVTCPEGFVNFTTSDGLQGKPAVIVLGDFLIIENYAIVIIVGLIGDCRAIEAESGIRNTDPSMRRYQVKGSSKELLRKEKYLWQEGVTLRIEDMIEEVCQTLAERMTVVIAPQLQSKQDLLRDEDL